MAIQPIVLSPATGLLDTTAYPNPPVGPATGDARHQIQGVIDQIIAAVNANIKDVLNSDTDGASGGDNVAMTAIAGLTGATVQEIMESLKTALDDAIMGAIPDDSLANIKLAADIKVGSLADLDTTDKDSVTDAINEAVGNVATVAGVVSAHLAETAYYSITKSGLDSNGIYTEVDHKRADDTLILKSVLSGGTSPQYTTKTETKYAANGTTVEWTKTYTITYDSNGNVASEVLSA